MYYDFVIEDASYDSNDANTAVRYIKVYVVKTIDK